MTTFLSVVGVLLVLVGGFEIYSAMTLVVTLDIQGQTVANFQLMEIQTADILLGGFAFVSGSVFVSAACLYHAVTQRRG